MSARVWVPTSHECEGRIQVYSTDVLQVAVEMLPSTHDRDRVEMAMSARVLPPQRLGVLLHHWRRLLHARKRPQRYFNPHCSAIAPHYSPLGLQRPRPMSRDGGFGARDRLPPIVREQPVRSASDRPVNWLIRAAASPFAPARGWRKCPPVRLTRRGDRARPSDRDPSRKCSRRCGS